MSTKRQASTIPTIAPALRLVGATSGEETNQRKLGLKLSTLTANISPVYNNTCFLTDNAILLKMLKVAYLFVFTKCQLKSKKSPNLAYPVSLRKWTSTGLKPLTYVEH